MGLRDIPAALTCGNLCSAGRCGAPTLGVVHVSAHLTSDPVQSERDTGAVLAPARPDPDLDDGDHDRMAHIVWEGYTPKEGDYVPVGTTVVEGIVNGVPVRALCGKVWVPGRNPARYGLCP